MQLLSLAWAITALLVTYTTAVPAAQEEVLAPGMINPGYQETPP